MNGYFEQVRRLLFEGGAWFGASRFPVLDRLNRDSQRIRDGFLGQLGG